MTDPLIVAHHPKCPERDVEVFRSMISHLESPLATVRQGRERPFGSDAHVLQRFRLFQQCCEPQHVLEIGFAIGLSASMLLCLGVPKICSIDINNDPLTQQCVAAMRLRFGDRWRFIHGDSKVMTPASFGEDRNFDAAFIDGDHGYEAILSDIRLCRELGIGTFLFDDIFPHISGAWSAIRDSGLIIWWVSGNLAAARDPQKTTFVSME